ncbi:hypothetical protein IDH15_00970 [Pelagibacterales bacterium SAG-MED38]|nr:hypothetical protein [Pelagibacterales bacterium SAG-MED38]
MKKLILITAMFCLNFNTYSFSNEVNCDGFKKFTISYMSCKANLIKNKTVSAGKNFVEDTKSYQKKEWSKEKKKLKNLKEKILEK